MLATTPDAGGQLPSARNPLNETVARWMPGLVLALTSGSALPDAVAQAVRTETTAIQNEGKHLQHSVARR